MTLKTELNIRPKVFWGTAAGVGLAFVTAIGDHLNPNLFSFLPIEWQAPAVMFASTCVSGAVAWLKKEAADETPAQQAVSATVAHVVAQATEDATAGMASEANPVMQTIAQAAEAVASQPAPSVDSMIGTVGQAKPANS